VSIPAVGIVRHDHDNGQADGEEVGDDNENIIETWPGLLQSGDHPNDDRQCDQSDEYDIDDEQFIASCDRILVVWCWPCRVDTERYISHLVASVCVRGVAYVEEDTTVNSEETPGARMGVLNVAPPEQGVSRFPMGRVLGRWCYCMYVLLGRMDIAEPVP
jgi:hypothetical protein